MPVTPLTLRSSGCGRSTLLPGGAGLACLAAGAQLLALPAQLTIRTCPSRIGFTSTPTGSNMPSSSPFGAKLNIQKSSVSSIREMLLF